MKTTITELIVADGCGNYEAVNMLELRGLGELKRVEVGKHCFKYVNELRLSRLPKVESVLIGDCCFCEYNWMGVTSNHSFALCDCPLLREFRLGAWSFSDTGRGAVDKDSTMITVNRVKDVSDPFKDASRVKESSAVHAA